MSVDKVLTTTRAVRKRLDLDRPVPREVLMECLDLAVQAPTGCNQQEWQWMFVTDPEQRRLVGDWYERGSDAPGPLPVFPTGDERESHHGRVMDSSAYLRDHIAEVPVLVIPCHAGRPEGAPVDVQAAFWGSVIPAMWSFQLALRSRGLGSSWTTVHLRFEREVAEVLGIPYDQFTQCGLFPVGYTIGTEFRRAPRRGGDEIVHWNSWQGGAPTVEWRVGAGPAVAAPAD
jgi:nitroreductase